MGWQEQLDIAILVRDKKQNEILTKRKEYFQKAKKEFIPFAERALLMLCPS